MDWEKSSLPKEYFIEKYKTISILLKDYIHNQKIYESNEIYGHLNLQKESIKPDIDYYINICPDMYFSEHLLSYLIQSIPLINNDYFVITPQICRMWDSTWDEIVNSNFEYGSYEDHGWLKAIDIFDVDNYLRTSQESVILKPIKRSKWAGWFDLYNKKFFEELAPIQDEWFGYGAWDYYSMCISEYAKQKNIDFMQYCLNGQIIFEYGCGPLRNEDVNGFMNYYKKQLSIKDTTKQKNDFDRDLIYFIQKQLNHLHGK
jgi:hypothetical protein